MTNIKTSAVYGITSALACETSGNYVNVFIINELLYLNKIEYLLFMPLSEVAGELVLRLNLDFIVYFFLNKLLGRSKFMTGM